MLAFKKEFKSVFPDFSETISNSISENHCSIFKSKMQSLFESWPIGDLKIPRKIACVRFETPNQING